MSNEREKRYIHICDVCGKTEVLTPMEAYESGWDYPPMMGSFGIVGPRTCPNCPINMTLWWALNSSGGSTRVNLELSKQNVNISDLDERHQLTLQRILSEPSSIEIAED